MACEHITDLAQRLAWLPTDGSDPTGVPAPLRAVLTPVKRYRYTAPSHAPINRLEYEFLAALALSGWSTLAPAHTAGAVQVCAWRWPKPSTTAKTWTAAPGRSSWRGDNWNRRACGNPPWCGPANGVWHWCA
jgi:hypothetical protein